MSWVIHLFETWAGVPTEFDHQFVKSYDPTWRLPDGSYDGGLLEVTPDPGQALQFETMADAIAKYREPYGWRPDGERNRPLTAWTAEFVPRPREEAKP